MSHGQGRGVKAGVGAPPEVRRRTLQRASRQFTASRSSRQQNRTAAAENCKVRGLARYSAKRFSVALRSLAETMCLTTFFRTCKSAWAAASFRNAFREGIALSLCQLSPHRLPRARASSAGERPSFVARTTGDDAFSPFPVSLWDAGNAVATKRGTTNALRSARIIPEV